MNPSERNAASGENPSSNWTVGDLIGTLAVMLIRKICWLALPLTVLATPSLMAQEPGLILTVSTRFLDAGFAHAVDKTSPVDVSIEKYHVVGSAKLTGRITYQPLPCDDGIRLQMILSGTAVGCDTSHVRRIQVHTLDQSCVCVRQEVLLTGQGVRTIGEASVSAPTVSRFRSAAAGGPVRDALVRSLARSQFRLLPGKTNRIATEISETVLRRELEHDLPATLSRANTRFREQFLETLTGFEIPHKNVAFSSASDAIQLRIVVPETSAGAAPAVEAADLTGRVHESVLNRIGMQLYGGSTQIGKDLEQDLGKIIHLVGGPPPGPSSATPWSITFSKEKPIVFRFDRNVMRIVLHGDEFELNKEQYKAMTVTVEYELERHQTGWRAVRHKLIDVTTPGLKTGEKPTTRQQVLRGFLATRLGQIFARELDLSRITLPEALGAAARATVRRALAQDGWLVLELVLP